MILSIFKQDDVRIFSAKEIDPFQVVTMIKFTTQSSNLLSNSIEKDMSVNWENNDDPFTTGRPGSLYGLIINSNNKISGGVYGKAVIDLVVEMSGFKSFSFIAKLNLKLIIGASININNPQFQQDLYNLFSVNIPINNPLNFNILGIDFGVSTSFDIKLDIKEIDLILELKYNLFKGYYFEFEKEIGVSSEVGLINIPHKFQIKEITDGECLSTLVEKISNPTFRLDFKPSLTVAFNAAFKINEEEYCPITISLISDVPIQIAWIPGECPWPPLYAGISFASKLKFNCEGFSKFSYQKIGRAHV